MSSIDNGRNLALQKYYSKYLNDVRCVSQSTINHYIQALRTISERLKSKGEIIDTIYEVSDINRLMELRDLIYHDDDFIALDTRGNRMYSVGFNHYCNFASGSEWIYEDRIVDKLDIPLEPEIAIETKQKIWPRSNILRIQTIKNAHYKCEINENHQTFIAESTGEPYMEGHHAIPMHAQPKFDKSLDVYANIICMCPICHRQIHYGLIKERERMLENIYIKRIERLIKSGINLSKDEFISAAMAE